MPVYVIIDIEIKDKRPYYEYVDKVRPIVEKYNGSYLARGGKVISLFSDWAPERIILIEFPSIEDVQRCFGSAEYKEIAPLREASTVNRSIVIEGLSTPPKGA